MRRLRAKQASEATVAEIKTLRAPENPNRKPRRHKVQGRNDNKLGKAPLAEQKVRLRGGFTASIRWKAANQHLIADDAGGQEGDLYFNYWGPAEAADAEHFEAVQTALRAAREAEDLARRAKEATGAVSVAKGSRDEEYAIIVANVTRHQAELAAFVAKQTAKHAAEREETAEAVRAELRVVVERDPLYWVEGRKDVGLYVRALFRDKVALDKNFREAISYIRSNFMVSKGELGEVIPLAHDITSNAPVSAIKYLQEFDTRVVFRSIIAEGEKRRSPLAGTARDWVLHAGHYITKDDDGMPIAIFWPTNAPSDISTDPDFQHEIQKIRSFTARWARGEKSCHGQNPFADIPSISIIICTGRWHQTWTGTAHGEPPRSVLSVSISNEKLWNQGLYYRGIHIGTKDDAITSEYDWWSYGRPEIRGGKSIDIAAAPIHVSTSTTHSSLARGLLRATLRSVEEPVLPVLAKDVERAEPGAQLRLRSWIASCERRAAEKYGKASDQYYLIRIFKVISFKREEVRMAVSRKQWAPSWEIMMGLDQDKQRLESLEPRTPPRTLGRRRLLRPHPSPASASTSTGRLPRAERHWMRSILSPEAAPGTQTVSSNGSEDPVVVRLVYSTSRSARPKSPRDWMRGILSPVDSTSDNTTASSDTEETSTRRASTSPRTPQPHNSTYRADGLLTTLDLSPETAAGSSEAEGREDAKSR
ncbi:hypothetical protein F5883DRAFT_641735 [Diaporthe sp. PMI_573]|nr:hypothetical protein F5883DRAFT_641735 [Diaporthaceae sp. PMI_573]